VKLYIYILLFIENATGMPRLKITMSESTTGLPVASTVHLNRFQIHSLGFTSQPVYSLVVRQDEFKSCWRAELLRSPRVLHAQRAARSIAQIVPKHHNRAMFELFVSTLFRLLVAD